MRKIRIIMLLMVAVPTAFFDVSLAQESPVRIHPQYRHYFADTKGEPFVIMGDYTWETFSGINSDYAKMFASLRKRGLNEARVWLWWGCEEFNDPWPKVHIEPFMRPGPGNANDGRLKYDLEKFNPVFFSRLKDFCRAASKNGINLQLIMMDAWMIKKDYLWKLHAFNRDNNINGVDGDPRSTGLGTDGKEGFCSMGNAKAMQYQKAYIKKVVETVNEFNNLWYEIANENYYSEEWELSLCDFIKGTERNLPKQHMTIRRDFPSHSYVIQKWDPRLVHKGILEKRNLGVPLHFDTDWTINKNDDEVRKAAWSAAATGAHFAYMDDSMDFYADSTNTNKREKLHSQIDHLARFVRMIHPWEMAPGDSLVNSGYAFLLAGRKEMFAYLPDGGSARLDLSGMKGKISYRWYSPVEGKLSNKIILKSEAAGGIYSFTAPGNGDAALLIMCK